MGVIDTAREVMPQPYMTPYAAMFTPALAGCHSKASPEQRGAELKKNGQSILDKLTATGAFDRSTPGYRAALQLATMCTGCPQGKAPVAVAKPVEDTSLRTPRVEPEKEAKPVSKPPLPDPKPDIRKVEGTTKKDKKDA